MTFYTTKMYTYVHICCMLFQYTRYDVTVPCGFLGVSIVSIGKDGGGLMAMSRGLLSGSLLSQMSSWIKHRRCIESYRVPPPLHLLRAWVRAVPHLHWPHCVFHTCFTNVLMMTVFRLSPLISSEPWKQIIQREETVVWPLIWRKYLLYLLCLTQDRYPYFAPKLLPFLSRQGPLLALL